MTLISKQLNKKLQNVLKQRAFSIFTKIHKTYPHSQIFLVGGAVRDIALGRDCKDYDFVVRGITADELEAFLATHGTVNLVGKTFGVFKFVPNSPQKFDLDAFDIALPRTEQSLNHNGVYRDFDIQSDHTLPIKEDLSRRDFTINSMAWNIHSSELVDPFDGQTDLEHKTIKTVGKPEDRFADDYSRMLRAIRFACQLDFHIDPKTLTAIRKLSNSINATYLPEGEHEEDRIIPMEIIAKELVKAFYYNPVRALDLFDETGFIKELMPELLTMKNCEQPPNWHAEGDVWTHTRLCLETLGNDDYKKQFNEEKASPTTVFATLFHDIGKPYTIKTPEEDGTDRIRFDGHDSEGAKIAQRICERLMLSTPPGFNVDPNDIAWVVKNHLVGLHGNAEELRANTVEKYFVSITKPSDVLLRVMYADSKSTVHDDGSVDMSGIEGLMKRVKEIEPFVDKKRNRIKALINGEDVMKHLKMNPGPKIGSILEAVREEQLQKRLKTKQDALTWIKKKYS